MTAAPGGRTVLPGAEAVIHLIRIGELESAILESISRPLSEYFEKEVTCGGQLPIPAESWNRRREQYAAEILLRSVPDSLPGVNALCLVGVDLFARGLSFVFGLADRDGRKAVVSLWRLRQEAYHLPRDDALHNRRLLTEAVHELGHTFGLPHCLTGPCVMRFSDSLAETDAKGWRLCHSCREKLEQGVGTRP